MYTSRSQWENNGWVDGLREKAQVLIVDCTGHVVIAGLAERKLEFGKRIHILK